MIPRFKSLQYPIAFFSVTVITFCSQKNFIRIQEQRINDYENVFESTYSIAFKKHIKDFHDKKLP